MQAQGTRASRRRQELWTRGGVRTSGRRHCASGLVLALSSTAGQLSVRPASGPQRQTVAPRRKDRSGVTGGTLNLAHGGLVEAIPFIVPALLVIGLLGGLVWRDRRRPTDDLDGPLS